MERIKRISIASAILMLACGTALAQAPASAAASGASASAPDAMGTSTDLFVMLGSDFDRPGAVPRSNYNIGIGHTFGFLKKDPFGDELTFAYTYENSGTHGFLHTSFGEHTESAGVMKNFPIPATKVVTGYTWIQTGLTSYLEKSKIRKGRIASFAVL